MVARHNLKWLKIVYFNYLFIKWLLQKFNLIANDCDIIRDKWHYSVRKFRNSSLSFDHLGMSTRWPTFDGQHYRQWSSMKSTPTQHLWCNEKNVYILHQTKNSCWNRWTSTYNAWSTEWHTSNKNVLLGENVWRKDIRSERVSGIFLYCISKIIWLKYLRQWFTLIIYFIRKAL